MRRRIALLLPVASYRNADFLAAAQALDVEVVAIADHCYRLAPGWGMRPLQCVPFDEPDKAKDAVVAAWRGGTPDAVIAVDDHGLTLAALLSEHWKSRGNPVEAVTKLRDKLLFRRLLAPSDLNAPQFARIDENMPAELPPGLRFPVVVKARRLSTSRAVIRADDSPGFMQAVTLARRIQRSADREAPSLGLLVESFMPGTEHALEAIVADDRLIPLALFDKPDPLDGPYFEESIYISPSRLPPSTQTAIADAAAKACRLAGIVTGPIHAEARVNAQGVWLLEIAPRSVGGLCGRVLEQFLGEPLERLILRSALGETAVSPRDRRAVGVMMIPVPCNGFFDHCSGVEEALDVDGITDVAITAAPGERVSPAPFGSSYLGFIFAETPLPTEAESALRLAHRALRFSIRPAAPLIAVAAAGRA